MNNDIWKPGLNEILKNAPIHENLTATLSQLSFELASVDQSGYVSWILGE